MNETKYTIDNPHENQKFSARSSAFRTSRRGEPSETDCIQDIGWQQRHALFTYATATQVLTYDNGPGLTATRPRSAILDLTTHPRPQPADPETTSATA